MNIYKSPSDQVERSVAVIEEYINNVWKMECNRRSSIHGSVYLDAMTADGSTLMFTVRISDHAPKDKRDGVIISDPRLDPMNTVSYLSWKYNLRDTQDIRDYRAMRDADKHAQADRTPVAEREVIILLMDMVNNMKAVTANENEKIQELRDLITKRTEERDGAVQAQRKLLKKIDDLNIKIDKQVEDTQELHRIRRVLKGMMGE